MTSNPDVVAALRFSQSYLISIAICYISWLWGQPSISGNFRLEPCSHGDFLGAILGTGITREKVGDILLQVYCFPNHFFFWMIWPFTTIFPFVIEMSIWFLLGGKRCSGPCWSRTCWLSDFYSRKGRLDILQFVHLFYHGSQLHEFFFKKKKQFTRALLYLSLIFTLMSMSMMEKAWDSLFSHLTIFWSGVMQRTQNS